MQATKEGYLDPSQSQISAIRKLEQFQGDVIDTIQNIVHPSYFWLIEFGEWKKQKLYWVDCSTYQLYDPQTKLVQSGRFLRLDSHPVPAKKRRRAVYKNNKSTFVFEDIPE